LALLVETVIVTSFDRFCGVSPSLSTLPGLP
jgi:hypothetical protein